MFKQNEKFVEEIENFSVFYNSVWTEKSLAGWRRRIAQSNKLY